MRISRLFDFIQHQVEQNPIENAFAMKIDDTWQYTSSSYFLDQVNQVSRGLLKFGIKPDDKIAIITSNNRTEWLIMDFAIQQIGAITVPIYPTLSHEDLVYVLNSSQSIFCIVSDQGLLEKIEKAKTECPALISTFTFDPVPEAPNWSQFLEMGEDETTQYEVEDLKTLIKPEKLATIIYTSGTTGKPKGVMLSHQNIVSNVLNCDERVVFDDQNGCKVLSFLPICHILERMVTYIFIYRSYSIYFAESIEKIPVNLKEVKPNIMTVVPRLVEKLYSAIYDKATASGGLKSKIFLWSIKLAEKYKPFENNGLYHKIADMLVYKKWREGLGGELKLMICGSAALAVNLNRMFFAAGMPILEGYGLTETSPVISVNGFSKDLFHLGTVGPLIRESRVKIADDGEILTKGPNIFMGYYNDIEKTKEEFTEDGWFKTGDVGHLEDGFLVITDRKKEIFKTSGGKYITPQVTENHLKQSRFIEQAMIVGDGEKMPCAFIQPDFKFIKDYIKFKNLKISSELSMNEIAANELIKKRIEKEIEKVNDLLGNWEKIKKIELTPNIWSVEGGELTPTLKLRRKIIKQKYIDLYNKMYEKES